VKPSINSKIRYNKSIPIDRMKKGDFKLTDFYFSRNKRQTDRKLATLKKRNCYIKKEKIEKVFSKMKKNPFKNQFIFQDQYKDLLVFDSPKLDLLITICFAILDHNRQSMSDDESQFLTFYESLLIRVSSATRI
jgi:hypothetical protein